jgi:hypothetical protein
MLPWHEASQSVGMPTTSSSSRVRLSAIDKMRLLREQATSIHTQQLSDEERIARLNELLATALTLPAAAAEEQSEEQSALPAAAHEQPDADDCT